MNQLTIHLVRHGEVNNNILGDNGVFAHNESLTNNGEKQAQLLAQNLAEYARGTTLVLCSPLHRAEQTAKIISKALMTPLEQDSKLSECDMGAWGKLPIKEVIENYRNQITTIDKASFRPPGGESWYDIAERMEECVKNASKMHDELVIVSHESPIQFLVGSLLRDPPETWLSRHALANCEYVSLRCTNDTWQVIQ